MKSEILHEKWYSFRRIYCTEGFIDIWNGDCINDPNNDSKQHLCLNSNDTYYRLNGVTEWYHKDEFKDIYVLIGQDYRLYFNSDDIWQLIKKV